MTTSPATEIIPYLFCRDVPASLDWLARTFGFTEKDRTLTEHGAHGEMSLDGCRIMLGAQSGDRRAPSESGRSSQGVFVYVADLRAHHARTVAAGGVPDGPPADHGYGLTYTVHDLDGHPWYFTQRPA